MDQDQSQSVKEQLLKELDRRIRGTLESNVVEQMDRDQRNADRMNSLVADISAGIPRPL